MCVRREVSSHRATQGQSMTEDDRIDESLVRLFGEDAILPATLDE